MIPVWKLKREIMRVVRQARDLPPELMRKIYFRRWHDLVTARQIRKTKGACELGQEVAIYLIFPSEGLLASHRQMLAEVKRAGISALVVSNLPLSRQDRETLLEETVLILERPNVGYDFGGYRDGMLELKNNLGQFERLWLLNDSVWILPRDKSWFEEARALGTDMAAASSNYAMPRMRLARFPDISWNHSTNHKNFHYASYALSFGSRILRDPKFLRYWQRLEIRNDKKRTVRRGEIGLSQWVLRRGYSHRATCEVDTLDQELENLDHAEIDSIARETVISTDPYLDRLKAKVLKSDPDTDKGRADRIALILTTVSRQASVYSIPGYTITRRGFQFLKKSPLQLDGEAQELMLCLIKRLKGKIDQEIFDEAQQLAHSRP